ncbi:uncharacterized protein LOC126798395 [Argentina anserina]|uniref:uncharacterized protein LOC126798395 n=1 Tax=Argentina anserina TaxID=57926 RepID=UPI002176602E|nr:uncharacterized protein LOC126798395 [Potentilla anserina]
MTENSTCFNSILRRLLCTGNVPTHPSSDYILDSSPTQLAKPPKNPKYEPKFQPLPSPSASVSPGIVARLMGLDSLPETNWVRTPELVTRSKSVSFADYLMDFDVTPTSQHRRVRTSVSFREVPAVMSQPEGQEFLVVYLDSVDKGKEFGAEVKKAEEVKQGKEQRRKNRESSAVIKNKNEEKVVKKNSKKISKLKNEPRRECGAQSSRASRNGKGDDGLGYSVRPKEKAMSKNGGVNFTEGSGEHSPLKKTTSQKKKKKVVAEPKFKKGNHQNAVKKREAVDISSCSENSSPVSVFDIDDILIQHETWLSEYSSPKDFKSPMKSPPRASYNEDPELRAVKFKDMEPIKIEDSEDYTELLASKIFRLTDEELKESNWIPKNVVEYERCEEICIQVEGLILDVLMNQAIDDLVQLS